MSRRAIGEALFRILAPLLGVLLVLAVLEVGLRVAGYDPSTLDRLCYGGEAVWRRFDHKSLRRGTIGFCRRQDIFPSLAV